VYASTQVRRTSDSVLAGTMFSFSNPEWPAPPAVADTTFDRRFLLPSAMNGWGVTMTDGQRNRRASGPPTGPYPGPLAASA
jgi:hypothetical protein